MAKATISFEVPEGLTEQEQSDLCGVLAAGLSEFAVRRCPADVYVANRYAEAGMFDELHTAEMVAKVRRRIDLAYKLYDHVRVAVVTHEPSLVPGHVITLSDFYDQRLDPTAAMALLECHFDQWFISFESTTWLVTGPEKQQAVWRDGAWVWHDGQRVAGGGL